MIIWYQQDRYKVLEERLKRGNKMKILSSKPTGMGGRYVLVDYGNNFFAYGHEVDMHRLCGFPVNQCGTKEQVLNHCRTIIELCKNNIQNFNKELTREKKNPNGWEMLIDHEKKQLEALIDFEMILKE